MNRETTGHGHRPYWKRAHRDGRMWVGVILMLTAMAVYLASNDRVSGPLLQTQPPLSNIPAKITMNTQILTDTAKVR